MGCVSATVPIFDFSLFFLYLSVRIFFSSSVVPSPLPSLSSWKKKRREKKDDFTQHFTSGDVECGVADFVEQRHEQPDRVRAGQLVGGIRGAAAYPVLCETLPHVLGGAARQTTAAVLLHTLLRAP